MSIGKKLHFESVGFYSKESVLFKYIVIQYKIRCQNK